MKALEDRRHPLVQQPSQYLTFMLGNDIYAMDIMRIREIIECSNLASIPRMPSFIRGVINLRGAVVPVIDLQARFGKQQIALTRRTCIVIVEVTAQQEGGETEHLTVGVMVDAVNEVLEISPADIEPAPSFGSNIPLDFIDGMGKVDGHFVIILDIDRVLSMEEIASLAGAVERSESVENAEAA
jgi:purine-binding chemotaxis protein CheW